MSFRGRLQHFLCRHGIHVLIIYLFIETFLPRQHQRSLTAYSKYIERAGLYHCIALWLRITLWQSTVAKKLKLELTIRIRGQIKKRRYGYVDRKGGWRREGEGNREKKRPYKIDWGPGRDDLRLLSLFTTATSKGNGGAWDHPTNCVSVATLRLFIRFSWFTCYYILISISQM